MARLRALPPAAATARRSSLNPTSTLVNPFARPRTHPKILKRELHRSRLEQLLSKVTKAPVKPRRRRPYKKLLTTLDSLADALPADEDTPKDIAGADLKDQTTFICRRSVKSKPGALKRREKVDRVERERFAQNMAQLTQTPVAGTVKDWSTGANASSNKWACLRTFISQTLEHRPDVKISTK